MELLFREDAYLREGEAQAVSVGPEGIRLDRTIFYPEGGGQPGDSGRLLLADGTTINIVDTRKGEASDEVLHIPAEEAPTLAPGTPVTMELDWERRHRHMRVHTSLHLLCSLIEGEVTGGQVGDGKGRLDFNLESAPDKVWLQEALNRLVEEDRPVRPRWIDDAELAAQPELVRTMSVKPPSGSGKVRLLEIEGVDLQPCGGTHVRSTGEIGRLEVGKIENKGRQNRRINLRLA
ncbi:alanyl-tRNA editing protein [Aquibaculum arenosum]|uniref:Alanine--tRNA ligase n=1 Tax=Aquibaculum arenosum TaxID=3032591 RepID=A0ABT5YLM3_9PROT|nr:alanyl-tRNA editing protein [Fodinicurvata sp. CAU 1616]MDF2095848.1 alanyl-tRNA editing protein [Fodinicurvata sp. CAU 1616]